MDVIVSLCGNSMIIIDQPVIILTFIDNDCTIISLVWTRNIIVSFYDNTMTFIDHGVITLISIDMLYAIILLIWTRDIYKCHCVIVW